MGGVLEAGQRIPSFSPILDKPSAPIGSQMLCLLSPVADDLEGSFQVSGDLTDVNNCDCFFVCI